jgi:membrane protease YdiL (CAAX protease family)
MNLAEELGVAAVLWLALAAVAGLACGVLWLRVWRGRGPLLRRRPWRPVPWGGVEVFCLFFLSVAWQILAVRFLDRQAGGPSGKAGDALRAAQAQALAFPVEVATVLFVLWKVRRARPYQVGLHANRLPANVILGYLTWLVLVPLVYVVDGLSDWLYQELTESAPHPHPLTQLVRGPDAAQAWLLVWLLAVVVAPVQEELLFRGVVQGWLLSRPVRGHLGMLAALLYAGLPLLAWLGARAGAPTSAEERDALADAPDRFLFALALFAGYLLLPLALGRRGAPARPAESPLPAPAAAEPGPAPEAVPSLPAAPANTPLHAGRAVYASSALFALIHPAWPSPIPLFVFGLGLGWLAYRTRSLVGPMVMHALFNTIGCLQLVCARLLEG